MHAMMYTGYTCEKKIAKENNNKMHIFACFVVAI